MSTRKMYVRWAIGLLMTLSVLLSASPAKAYVPEDAETGVRTIAASASTPRRAAAPSAAFDGDALGEFKAVWKFEQMEELTIGP